MIAALYVDPKGVYSGLPDVECWGLPDRDAREYAGPWPVVAHPPCSRWCRLAGLVQKRWGYRKGEDGGCFEAALAAVRKWGGVLEHPAYSRAWARFGLPNPERDSVWQRGLDGGWVAHVEQAHYGHRGRKATWLYAYGCEPLPLVWGAADAAPLWLSWCGNRNGKRGGIVPRMNKVERSATPIAFRDALLAIARTARISKQDSGSVVASDSEGVSVLPLTTQ